MKDRSKKIAKGIFLVPNQVFSNAPESHVCKGVDELSTFSNVLGEWLSVQPLNQPVGRFGTDMNRISSGSGHGFAPRNLDLVRKKADAVMRWSFTRRPSVLARIAGFTLIEIVTALAILVIGMVSILSLFPVGFQASGRAADYTKAAIFAQEKMEEIKMKGFDNAKSETEEDTGNTEGKFTRRVSITDVQEDKGYLKEVIVTVSWKERGKSCEKEFRTYIADYTP